MHVTYFCELLINNNPPTEQQTKRGRKREPRRKGRKKALNSQKAFCGDFVSVFFGLVKYAVHITSQIMWDLQQLKVPLSNFRPLCGLMRPHNECPKLYREI